MVEQATLELTAFGCSQEIVELVTSAGDDVPIMVKTEKGSSDFLPVAAGMDCEAAMYVERRRVYIALQPEDGRRLHSLTGVSVAEKNLRTWRLNVGIREAVDPDLRRHLHEAVRLSLRLSALRCDGSRGDETSRKQRTCPTCDLELPATGICDDHG